MSIAIKQGSLKYKDPATGQYKVIDVVGENITHDSQAFATGRRNDNPVPEGDPAYRNNSYYYSQQARQYRDEARNAATVDVTSIENALAQIQNALNTKVDDIKLNGTRIEFYNGNNELGYCELKNNSITLEKLTGSVQQAIRKMNNAMTTDIYDPTGIGQGETGVDPYRYSDEQNNALKGQILNTDIYTVDGVAYTGLRAALTNILAKAKEYSDLLLTTEGVTVDNDVYNGIIDAIEGVLEKAKTYANTKDNELVNNRLYNVDGVSYTGLIAALEGVLTKANTTASNILTQNYVINGKVYSGLVTSLNGILSEANDYTDSALQDYIPYSISVVNSLPTVGQDRTFYLIKKDDDTYEKWWYIDDGTNTDTKIWDQFGGGSSTKVVNSLPPAIEAEANIDYILKTSAGYMYYKWINNKWEIIAGSMASVVSELPSISDGNEYTDYYLENDGNYIHYRFKDGEFIQVGSAEDGYSTEDIDSMLSTLTNKVNTNTENITLATQRVSTLTTRLTNLQQTVDDLDTANYDYKATYKTETINDQSVDNVYRLYKLPAGTDIEDGQGTVVSEFVIQGGGGGGGTAASTLTVRRITPSPYVVTKDDQILLQFEYSSVNSDNEDVPGTYAWKIGNRTIATGNCIKGINTFDITEYITTIGITRVTLAVSDEGNSSTTKSYTIQKVDLYIESSFNQKNYAMLNTPIRFRYIPHGNVMKTVHFKLDGVETTEDTTASNETLEHIVAAQEYGTHLLEVWMTATINDTSIETNHIYKDLIWYSSDEDEEQPIISCIYRNDYYGNVKIKQYDSLAITYYVYDPLTFSPKVKKYVNDVYVDEEKIENNEGFWQFQTGQIGIHTLKLECRDTSLIIKVEVEKLNIDVDPVTSGLQIDFNPVGISNTSENRIWSNDNYHMIVSDNFDWAGGGYQIDNSGDSYFLVRAGSYITFDYNMFAGNTENNITTRDGAEIKICFMVENVQDVNAVWLSNVETTTTTAHDEVLDVDVTKTVNLGLQMSAHEAWLKTNKARSFEEGEDSEGTKASNTYLYMPYSEEDIIEMDINIDPISGGSNPTGFTLSYEDGVPSKAYIYDSVDRFYQQNPKPIKIGSEKCDIRIYRLKIYSRSLSTTEIMRNFIADARNSTTMLARYNKNSIYYDGEDQVYTPYKDKGILDPEKLAIRVPNVKILMLETDHFTTSKKVFVKSSLRCIHAPGGDIYPGDEYEDNWYFENGYHSGQGTTSDNYGQSGRNVDFLFNCDGVHKPSDKVEAEAGYVSRLTKGYLTEAATTQTCSDWKGNDCKVSLTRTSVPNNFFNLKVNIASSENVNNWLLQKRYNDFLPYISPAKRRDSRIKNDMEFVPAILFIKETNTETIMKDGQLIYSQHTEFNDTNWHFYALGNIGDSKKSDYTRSYDPTDKNEFTIEISDNTKNNATFQSGVYKQNGVLKCETFHREKSLDSEGKLVVINIPDVLVDKYEYPIPAAQVDNLLYKQGTIHVINNTGDPQYDGDEIGYINYRIWCLYNEDFDGDHSFEPRYACCGDYRDGKLVNDTGNGGKPQIAKNNEVWRAFYKWVITSTDTQFRNELDQWCVRSAVEFFYAFTHYYTMMDNRAKNTFWHFAKTGEYRQVSRPVPELLHIYSELVNNEYVTTSDTSIDTNKTYYTQYAFDLWDYDNDTALGINNNGQLIFPYGKEDTDYNIDGDPTSGWIFNGADSVFWCRLRDLLSNEIASTFNTVSNECFNANNLINQFDTRQECYPEEIWRLDIERKYLRTFTGASIDNSKTEKKQNRLFLRDMMQGRKKYQRRQWVRDQEMYFGTKYLINNVTGDSNRITFRCYNPGANAVIPPDYTLKITPATDMYVSAMFGNGDTTQVRAKANEQVELRFSVSTATDTQVTIYGANRIAALNDLSACYITAPNFSNAIRLKKLVLGNTTEGYNNARLQSIQLNNNQMLQELDLRNCKALAGGLNLSNSINLLRLYAENTQLASVTFARNGKVQLAHLPNTIQTLVMRGLNNLIDFQCSLIYLYNLTLEGGALDGQDIISDTVDTLHELRLYNINWELEDDTILKQMQNLSYSSISGDVYMLSYIGRREKEVYEEKWPDLTIHPNTTLPNGGIIPQYLVQFVNDDENETVLYSKYYNQGEYVEDPFAIQEIEKPTKPKDVEYQYSFGGWLADGSYIEWSGWIPNGENLQVSTDIKFKAKYASSVRTYTIKWWRYPNDPAGPLQTIDRISYGNGYQYNGPRPERKDEESFLRYYTFKGWDTLTTHITGDTDVYAVWDEFNGTPNINKDMKDMTPLEIYSVCRNNRQNDYWEARDYFDLFIGKDYYYNNVETITLGKDYLLSSAIARDVYAGNNGYYFNNSNISSSGRNAKVEKTDIRLFTSNIDSFTIAIDFQFGQKPVYTGNYGEEVLLSTFEVNPNGGGGTGEFYNTGFRLLRDSSGVVYLQVGGYRGSNRVQVGFKGQRDIVVITYRTPRIRGVTNYTFDIYSSWFTHNYSSGTSTPSINYRQFTFSTFKSESNEPITLGATSYGIATNGSPLYGDYANGTIHWCKIWKSDLASNDCYDLASWPREKLRMEYYGKEFYEYSYPRDALNQKVKGSWISSSLLGTFNPRRNYYYMPSYSYTYSSSMPRYLLVNRVWRAFPTEWQGIIAQTRVRYYTYTSSTSYYIDDYLFTPSVRDLSSSYNSSPYSVESGGTIPWMTSNFRRIKFYGIQCKDPTKTNYDVYGTTQPTTENHTPYDYYSIWYNPNYSCYYILVPGDMAVQYDLIQNTYSQSNTQGLTANPPAVFQVDLGVMIAGGLWIPAGSYDLRSPSSSSSGYHYAVSTSGSIVSNYYYNTYNNNYANYNGHPVSFNI